MADIFLDATRWPTCISLDLKKKKKRSFVFFVFEFSRSAPSRKGIGQRSEWRVQGPGV